MTETIAIELPKEVVEWLDAQAQALGQETGEQGITGAYIASAFVLHHFNDWTGGEEPPKEDF